MLFSLCMIWIFVLYTWIIWLVESSWLLYSFVGSIMNLCNCCYLDSTRIACMLRRARGAWWCVSKATSCRLWRDRYNLQGAGFGASTTDPKKTLQGSEDRLHRRPPGGSCRWLTYSISSALPPIDMGYTMPVSSRQGKTTGKGKLHLPVSPP
jgi:hypothetical protein